MTLVSITWDVVMIDLVFNRFEKGPSAVQYYFRRLLRIKKRRLRSAQS
jgi:hypothetical protein